MEDEHTFRTDTLSSLSPGRRGKQQPARSWKRLGVLSLLIAVFALVPLLWTLSSSQHQAHADNSSPTTLLRPVVGINAFPQFADAMKTARPYWYGSDFKTLVPVDTQNWPTTDARVLAIEGLSNADGTYRLIFNGQATVTPFGAKATISNQQYSASTNTTTATLVITDTGSINFWLIFSNTKRTASSATNTGVTTVKLLRPTSEGATTPYDSSVLFTTQYVQAIAPYPYLRFMGGTNWNTSKTWADRTRPLEFDQHKVLPGESGFEGNQMAFEYMVALCNQTNKDLYVNVPALVDDDYITKLSQLIRYGSDGVNPYTSPQSHPVFAPLNANLHVYIEYSNETWNWGFAQSHQINALASAEVKAGHSNLNYDGSTNGGYWGWRYTARRILQISMIFRATFGDAAMMTRIRPLLEWQYNNGQDTANQELNFLNNYYNNGDGKSHVATPHPVYYYIWGGGGAVYYHSNNDKATTVDGIYASGIPSSDYQGVLNSEGAWAHAFNLHFVAYEGGFAVGGDNATSVQQQARFDPRAKQSMIDSFNDFTSAGGELYTAGTYGQWHDPASAPSSPLVQAAALINSSSFTPAPMTLGTAVSSSGQTTVTPSPDTRGSSFSRPDTGTSAFYVLRVAATGAYSVAITTSQNGPSSTGAPGQAQIFVNGEPIGPPVAMPASSTVSFGTISLQAGVDSLRILAVHATHDPAYPNDPFHFQWQPTAIVLAPATGTPTTGGSLTATPTATVTATTTPTATATPTSKGFSTSFESGQAQPSWTNTVDSTYMGGGIQNVGGICCNLTGPEAGVRQEKAHSGKAALMYSGLATSNSAYAYLKVFDLSSQAITVDATTTLEYWINPRTNFGSTTIATNSTCVALDVVFSDGTTLRSSGAVDQNGNPATPAGQCTKLTDETWNHVVIKLGTRSAGKQIVRLDLGAQPSSTGGYRGYLDDISIHE